MGVVILEYAVEIGEQRLDLRQGRIFQIVQKRIIVFVNEHGDLSLVSCERCEQFAE